MAADLAVLVQGRRKELGLSYHSLAAASIDEESGATASSGWIHRLETGAPVIPPSLEALGALAAGLRLPRSLLQEAAAAQFFDVRLPWEASGEAADLLAALAKLPERQRQALANLVRVLAGDS